MVIQIISSDCQNMRMMKTLATVLSTTTYYVCSVFRGIILSNLPQNGARSFSNNDTSNIKINNDKSHHNVSWCCL